MPLTLSLVLQKDEQPEEEKPLTLSNGFTTGEPTAENGKPQNGHIILSPPVSPIFTYSFFILFNHLLADIERKGWFL